MTRCLKNEISSFPTKKGVLEENGKLNERFIPLREALTHTISIDSVKVFSRLTETWLYFEASSVPRQQPLTYKPIIYAGTGDSKNSATNKFLAVIQCLR